MAAAKIEKVVKFEKTAILASDRYAMDYDIVNAVLKDDQQYTIAQVEEAVKKFKRGKVN